MGMHHIDGMGKELATGMFDPGNSIEGQSGQLTAAGELKTYRNKDGDICSLYVVDQNEFDITFEGLMKKAGYEPKDVGDPLTGVSGVTIPTGGKLLVQEWEEVYSNEDVVKVRGKVHLYILAAQ